MPRCSRGIFARTPWSSDWADGDKTNCAAGFASAQKLKRRGHNVALLGQFAVRQRDVSFLSDQSRQQSRIMNNIIWLVGAVVIVLFVLGYFGLR